MACTLIRPAVLLAVVCVIARAESQTAPGSIIEIRKPDKTVSDADAGKVTAVAYNQNGSILATAGDAKVVKLWDANKGVLVGVLAGHAGHISFASFSKDGNVLAANSPREGKGWDVNTGKIVLNLPAKLDTAGAMAWSRFYRDGKVPIAG